MKTLCVVLLLCGAAASSCAQAVAPGSGWERLKALPAHTRMHVDGDKAKRKCRLEAVDDEQLVCSKGSTQFVFPRGEVKSVKLVRVTRSTLVGLGIGLGAGLGVGAIIGEVRDPSHPNSELDFSGIGRDVYVGAGAAVGLIGGGVVGGTTDFLRGPVVYQRP